MTRHPLTVTVADPVCDISTRPGVTLCPPPDLSQRMTLTFGDHTTEITDNELKLAMLLLPSSFKAIRHRTGE